MNSLDIRNNKHLCFLGPMARVVNNSDIRISRLKDNKLDEDCRRDKQVCYKACNQTEGCWGPGPQMCVSCLGVMVGDNCRLRCEDQPGFYTNGTECVRCHPNCPKTCSGPGKDQCVGVCESAQLDDVCVDRCPSHMYPKKGSKKCKNCCTPCSTACIGTQTKSESACSGPSHLPGPNGCSLCERVVLDRNSSIVRCAPKCREDFFLSPVTPNIHRRYPGLTNYTTSSARLCVPCDPSCSMGCHGASTDCLQCRPKMLIYEEGIRWSCNETCPFDKRFVVNETEDGVPVCLEEKKKTLLFMDQSISSSPVYLYAGGSALFFSLLVVVTMLIVYLMNRKSSRNRKKSSLYAKYTRNFSVEDREAMQDNFELRIITATRLTKMREIGCGAFGTVFKGAWTPELEEDEQLEITISVIIKELKATESESSSNDILEEARLMASVNHQHCLGLLGVCLSPRLQLITEFMSLGNLQDYLPANRHELTAVQMLNWALQIARGMMYLESRGIVHCDLACRNVLLQNENHVRITDFGMAKLLDPGSQNVTADDGLFPIKWLAPESMFKRIFSEKSDVWAYGVTLWEIFTFGKRPYPGISTRELPQFLRSGERLSQPIICSVHMYTFMVKCWLLEPGCRPTFAAMVDEMTNMIMNPDRYLNVKWSNERRPSFLTSCQGTPLTSRAGSQRGRAESNNLPPPPPLPLTEPEKRPHSAQYYNELRQKNYLSILQDYLIPDSEQGSGNSAAYVMNLDGHDTPASSGTDFSLIEQQSDYPNVF